MKRLLVALLLLSSGAEARTRSVVAVPTIGTNSAQSGVVGFDGSMFPFVNMEKTAVYTVPATGCAIGNNLTLGSNLPNGTMPCQTYWQFVTPTNYTGKFVTSYTGTLSSGGLEFDYQGFHFWGTVYSLSGGSITGCSNGNVPPCQFTDSSHIVVSGTNPVVTLDFSSAVSNVTNNGSGLIRVAFATSAGSQQDAVTVTGVVGSDGNGCGANGSWPITNKLTGTVDLVGSTFPTGCTYISGGKIFPYGNTDSPLPIFVGIAPGVVASNMTSFIFCKQADYLADNTCNTTAGKPAWAGGFNDDFVASLAAMRPAHIRFLDVNNTINNGGINLRGSADFASMQTSSAATYGGQFWTINNWFGSNSGTNSYSIACSNGQACTYKLTGGSPADGDFVQFYNVNANTSANPTLTITDASSVTSSAIPIMNVSPVQKYLFTGGTITAGDTISLTFTTTSLGAYACLAGGTHTTAAYTVLNTDTVLTLSDKIFNTIKSDSTLAAQPLFAVFNDPLTGTGAFDIGYASNACALTITANITGSATETITFGTYQGTMGAGTLHSMVYSALLGAFIDQGLAQGATWPYFTQMQLANAVSIKSGVRTKAWLQIPMFWSNASFTALANQAFANFCATCTKFEYGNEVWNFFVFYQWGQAYSMGASLGLGNDEYAFYELRQRQLWGIASSIFGSSNLQTMGPWQLGNTSASELSGTKLCGTSCGNQAYQNIIGVDYNSAPNRPGDFTTHLGQAPYYGGAVLNSNYFSSATYGSWSGTCSITSNVLNCSAVGSGTIIWNQGVSLCDGTYIAAPVTTDPTSAQLTGKVTSTLNGAMTSNQRTITLTSTTGVQSGMWMWDATSQMFDGTVLSVTDSTHLVIVSTAATFPSIGSNDTIVFGGKAGTYQLNSTTCSSGSTTITGGDVLGLQYATDNYLGLNSAIGSQQDALNWAYIDMLFGVNSNQWGSATPMSRLQDYYRTLGAIASSFSIDVEDYEGGYASIPPTQSQATAMGLPSVSYGYTNSVTYADGFIGQFLYAFKNSATFKAAVTFNHNQEIAILPTGSMGQWYVDSSNERWALWPIQGLYSPTGAFQSNNAIGCYNGNASLC